MGITAPVNPHDLLTTSTLLCSLSCLASSFAHHLLHAEASSMAELSADPELVLWCLSCFGLWDMRGMRSWKCLVSVQPHPSPTWDPFPARQGNHAWQHVSVWPAQGPRLGLGTLLCLASLPFYLAHTPSSGAKATVVLGRNRPLWLESCRP